MTMIATKAFALAAVLLALPRASESAGGDATPGQTTVVVVGAGASGLSAARKITDEWPSGLGKLEVVVLEARDRTGGRIWTNRNPDASKWPGWGSSPLGGVADLGGSWIHSSQPDHPVTLLANQFGLQTAMTDANNMELNYCDGTTEAGDQCKDVRFTAWATGNPTDRYGYSNYANRRNAAVTSVACGTVSDMPSLLEAMLATSPAEAIADPLFQFWLGAQTEFTYGGAAEWLSACWFNDDSYWNGKASGSDGVTERIFPAGYSGITDGLAMGTGGTGVALDVRLNSVITNIDYQQSYSTIRYTESGSPKTITADYVVLTVPLGVLKASPDLLTPRMPFAMQDAVNKIGMGNVNKLVLKFDSADWLDGSTHFYAVADTTSAEERGLFTWFLNLKPFTGENIVVTFGFGAAAITADNMSNEQAWAKAKEQMVKIFGNVIPAQPAAMMRSDWSNDPFARGTYSYASVAGGRNGAATGQTGYGSYFELFNTFSVPGGISNKVFMAGEHTTGKYRGTIHGAVVSGQAAAGQIINRQTALGGQVIANQAKAAADAAAATQAQADAEAAAAAKAQADAEAAATKAAADKAAADAAAAEAAATKAAADKAAADATAAEAAAKQARLDDAVAAAKTQEDADAVTAAAAQAQADIDAAAAAAAAAAQAQADADAAAAAAAQAQTDTDAAAAAAAAAAQAQADADADAAAAAAAAQAQTDTDAAAAAAAAAAQPDADATAATDAAAKVKADADANCATWASAGECDTNPTWMQDNCKASCEAITKAPITKAPITKAPITEAPAAPVTEAPTAAVTEAPAAPVTEAPTAATQAKVTMDTGKKNKNKNKNNKSGKSGKTDGKATKVYADTGKSPKSDKSGKSDGKATKDYAGTGKSSKSDKSSSKAKKSKTSLAMKRGPEGVIGASSTGAGMGVAAAGLVGLAVVGILARKSPIKETATEPAGENTLLV